MNNEQQLHDCQLIVNEILAFFPKNTNLVGAELGVKEGYLSRTFLSTNANLIMYSIDLWAAHPSIDETHNHNENYILAVNQLSAYNERSIIKRKLTLDAVNDFMDNSLDFVFIDATHTYDAVKQEIKAWSRKVKPDGWLFGHDYTPGWPGVVKAVNECVTDVNQLKLLVHTCWAAHNNNIKQ